MVQTQVINRILTDGYERWVLEYDLNEDYFSDFKDEFNFIKDFYNKYDTTVDVYTFLNNFKNFDRLEVDDPEISLISRLRLDLQNRLAAKIFNDLRKDIMSSNLEDKSASILKAYKELEKAINKTSIASFRSEEEFIRELEDKFRHAQKHRNDVFIPTGVDGLEDLHGWDKEADYVVVAGRPNEGKSYILCKFALEAAKQGLNVGFISLEMPVHQIDHRITSMITHLSLTALDKGYDNVAEPYMEFLKNERSKYHIHYADSNDFGGTPNTSSIETFCLKKNIDILFIDQMSYLVPEGKKNDDWRDIASISRSIKRMRDKLNIPVIVANQLNRTRKQEKEVDLVQLAGSDVIGQDATKVIAVERIEKEGDIFTKLTIVKNRSGKAFGKVKLKIDFDKGTFNRPDEVINTEVKGEENVLWK